MLASQKLPTLVPAGRSNATVHDVIVVVVLLVTVNRAS